MRQQAGFHSHADPFGADHSWDVVQQVHGRLLAHATPDDSATAKISTAIRQMLSHIQEHAMPSARATLKAALTSLVTSSGSKRSVRQLIGSSPFTRQLIPEEDCGLPFRFTPGYRWACARVDGLVPGKGYHFRVARKLPGANGAIGPFSASSAVAWTASYDPQQVYHIQRITTAVTPDGAVNIAFRVANASLFHCHQVPPPLAFLVESCSDDCTESSSPIVFPAAICKDDACTALVAGLKLGMAYRFIVRAVSSAGLHAASDPTPALALPVVQGRFYAVGRVSSSGYIQVYQLSSGQSGAAGFSGFDIGAAMAGTDPLLRLGEMAQLHAACAIVVEAYTNKSVASPHKFASDLLARSGIGEGTLNGLGKWSEWTPSTPSVISNTVQITSISPNAALGGLQPMQRGLKQVLVSVLDVLNTTASLDIERYFLPELYSPCIGHTLLPGLGGSANFVRGRVAKLDLLKTILQSNFSTKYLRHGFHPLVNLLQDALGSPIGRDLWAANQALTDVVTCTTNSNANAFYRAIAWGHAGLYLQYSQRVYAAAIQVLEEHHSPGRLLSFTKVATLDTVHQQVVFTRAAAQASMPVTLHGWLSAWTTAMGGNITAPLVACNPFACLPDSIQNADTFHRHIVIAERGDIPLGAKARFISDLGAEAIVFVDDAQNRCKDDYFGERCVVGSDLARGEGFAYHDNPDVWSDVTLPVMLLSRASGLQLVAFQQS